MTFSIPTEIHYESYTELIFNLQKIQNKSIVLLLSHKMENRFYLKEMVQQLKEKNTLYHIDNINPNPTEIDIYQNLKQLDGNIDIVIAIGGGSTIDLGKSIIALSYTIGKQYDRETLLKIIENKEYLDHNCDIIFIAVPTTAGTGSEVTKWGTIWKSDKTAKLSVEASWLIPDKAYIVTELALDMPLRLSLSTGFDALSHAVESYWSKKSNPLTREQAKAAIRIIVEYLPKVLDAPTEIKYREKMCTASMLAGFAFANTKTTACHSISYPLTMKFGIEHGFACILSLSEVMKRNRSKIIELDKLLEAFGVVSIEEVGELIQKISKNVQNITLSSFGVKKTQLHDIAKASFTFGRMDNNPVEFNENDIEEILNLIY